MGKVNLISKGQEIEKAKFLARTLGVRAAAGYMRKRGWSLEAALFTLLGK